MNFWLSALVAVQLLGAQMPAAEAESQTSQIEQGEDSTNESQEDTRNVCNDPQNEPIDTESGLPLIPQGGFGLDGLTLIDSTVWFYRVYEGKEQKRLWSITQNKWLSNWTYCEDVNKNTTMLQTARRTGRWLNLQGHWYYLTGTRVRTGWVQVNHEWYYMNDDGEMQTGWITYKGSWYYLKQDGRMQTGWAKINSKWYYFDSDGRIRMGWLKDKNHWYYLSTDINDCSMLTGWQKIDGKWYYFDESGAMLSSCTKKINGVRYRFSASGAWIK